MFDGATTSVHSNLAIGRVCGDHREIMAVVSPTATDDDVWRVVNLKSKGSDTDQFDSIAVLGAIDDDQAVEWAFNQRGRFLLDSIVLSVGETNTPGLKRYLDSERLNYRANSQIHLNQLSKLQDMTTGQPVMWDGVNLKSHSNSSAVLLVDLVKHDDNSQLFDAIKADDMPALLELLGAEAMGYDALIVESRKLDTLMQRLSTAMSKATQSGVTVTNVRQSEPFKRNKVTQVAAIFEMSDGQSVSIVFHNPDSTPSKLLPQDTLISWKFLLNSRDISAAVQPNQGEDVQLPVLATRVMKLVNQNSARFARTNAKKAENVAALDEAKARIETKSQTVAALDAEIAQLQAELDKPVPVDPEADTQPQLSTRAEVFKILTSDYGWSESRISGGIEKTFSGLGASGQMSDGSRTLSANFDSKERYLAVTDNTAPTGGAIIPSTEIDARIGGYTPDGFIVTAKAFNDAVEDYVLDERNKLLPEPTLTKTDMGNGESLVEGMAENRDGTFTALTLVESKTFKTRAGAERWLAQRGLNPDGTRMAKPEPTPEVKPDPTAAMRAGKMQAHLNQSIQTTDGKVTTIGKLIDLRISQGGRPVEKSKRDAAAEKRLMTEFEALARNAPIGNSNHPDTIRLNELKAMKKDPSKFKYGEFVVTVPSYFLEGKDGEPSMVLTKTGFEYAQSVVANMPAPTPAVEPESLYKYMRESFDKLVSYGWKVVAKNRLEKEYGAKVSTSGAIISKTTTILTISDDSVVASLGGSNSSPRDNTAVKLDFYEISNPQDRVNEGTRSMRVAAEDLVFKNRLYNGFGGIHDDLPSLNPSDKPFMISDGSGTKKFYATKASAVKALSAMGLDADGLLKKASEPEPSPTVKPTPEEPTVTATNPDAEFFQSIISGTIDPLTVDMDYVIKLAEKHENDPEMGALLEDALEAINKAEQAASQGI